MYIFKINSSFLDIWPFGIHYNKEKLALKWAFIVEIGTVDSVMWSWLEAIHTSNGARLLKVGPTFRRVDGAAERLECWHNLFLPNLQGYHGPTDTLIYHGVVIWKDTLIELKEFLRFISLQEESLHGRYFETVFQDFVDDLAGLAAL